MTEKKPIRRSDEEPDVTQDEDGTWYVRRYTRREGERRFRNPDGTYRNPQWHEPINGRWRCR